MTTPPTICVTQPGRDGRCWVFIDPPLPQLAFNREFVSIAQAHDYAFGLAKTSGWLVEQAGHGALKPADADRIFGAPDVDINARLWQMIGIAEQLPPARSSRYLAEAAQEIAGILTLEHPLSIEADAAMMRLGAALLLLARDEMDLPALDDVLAAVMPVAAA